MSLPSFDRTTIAVLFGMAAGAPTVFAAQESSAPLPGQMPKIGEVDQRYQAYNLDLMAITGMPKKPAKAASEEAEVAKGKERLNTVMSGVKLDEPLDLQNRRLRILATGLGPAYLRTSGTSAFRTTMRPRWRPRQLVTTAS